MQYQWLPFMLSFLFLSLSNISAQQKVNIDNFVQAETHQHFQSKAERGGFGKLVHNRKVISIDDQYIRRMNRDTRYSSGIFDLNEPLTVILPNTGNRFILMTITNENHYIKKTIYKPGSI